MVDVMAAGLTPKEFWDLSPFEVGAVLAGHLERQTLAHELESRFVAPMMTMWAEKGKKIKPTQLFRRADSGEVEPESVEDLRAELTKKQREEEGLD